MEKILELQFLLQALSDANRLKIIHTIGETSKSVSEIVEETALSQPLVSHHLKKLRERNILISHKEGVKVNYELKNQKLLEAIALLTEMIE